MYLKTSTYFSKYFLLIFLLLFCNFEYVFLITTPRGVPLSKLSFYEFGTPFTCIDGSATISWSKVNDDYCDCRDGSDEPGTPACPNGVFSCRNMDYQLIGLPSSYVNDEVCDCCDGGDEYLTNARCDDVCATIVAKINETRNMKRSEIDEGHKAYKEFIVKLKIRKEEQRIRDEEERIRNEELERRKEELSAENQVENPMESSESSDMKDEKQPEQTKVDELNIDSVGDQDKEEKKDSDYPDENRSEDKVTHDLEHQDEIYQASETDVHEPEPPIPVEIDYGPEEGFRILSEAPGGCLEYDDREYTYSLCAFRSVHQRPKGSSSSPHDGTLLGSWSRWQDEGGLLYSTMIYENGAGCWNGPSRSTKVHVHCSDTNAITSVSEPSRCQYVMHVKTPAACYEDPDVLFEKIHTEL